MTIVDTFIDQVFDGRYRVVRKLGSGGMANVYLAEDQELGRRVAIKILNDRHAHDEQFVERFRREAKNAAGLSHPNIVSIYDRGEAEGSYYIAMEYLEGRTLKELIVSRGPGPIHVAIDYTRQILAAVGFAHRGGIVHRDIKPHNVMIGPDGRVKVTDFGIARSGASQMTEVGSIIGTAQYLSPEQARGAPVDQTSDLYSVGVVLYEMLTGTVPFTGATPLEIAMKHLSATPEPPSAKRPEIPNDLDMIVLRALAKDPAARYQSAEQMDADLARVARGISVSPETTEAATAVLAGAGAAALAPTAITRASTDIVVRPAPPMPPAPREYYYEGPPPRRRPFWPWLLALGLVVAAGVAGWLLWDQIQDQLNANKPVTVPLVEGIAAKLAVAKIEEKGLKAKVFRSAHGSVAAGIVFDQQPEDGDRVPRDSTVRIVVSTGKERVRVPDVRGSSATDAVAALKDVGLEYKIFYLNSDAEEGTVTGQDPGPGEVVVKGSSVRINVSKGPEPVTVPSVIRLPYDEALGQLQGQGFAVAREDVESDEPEGTVIAQQPEGNTLAPPGSTVTLSVSEGPQEIEVPDVTTLDRRTAAVILRDAGFRIAVEIQETEDPNEDRIVLSQDPGAGEPAPPGSAVTIIVGRFVAPPTDTVPTETVPTDTVPTDTVPTETVPTETVPTLPAEPPPPPEDRGP
ncbi:MAG: Stk1 family PASTA domain-containing Ser/Thr kinase [Gaiellaceae bacterium]